LGTKDRAEATALFNARNESVRQPQLNRQIAKAYLAGTDSGISTRTWQDAFNAIIEYKQKTTKERWQRGARQKAFDLIRRLVIIETQAEQLLTCMKAGTVSTIQTNFAPRSLLLWIAVGIRTRLERSLGRCRALLLGKTESQWNGLLESGNGQGRFHTCRKSLKD